MHGGDIPEGAWDGHVADPATSRPGAAASAVGSAANRSATATGRRGLALRMLLIALACAVVYAGSLSAPFFFDDVGSIPENPAIRSLATALQTPDEETVAGRPVVALTLALNYALGGLDVTGYHLFNLGVHIVAAWLLMLLVAGLLRTPRLASGAGRHADGLAFATALVWALHPLQTEAVVYVIQRTELIMGACYLGVLWTALRGLQSARPARWFVASALACAVGMGTKEVMVTAPLMVLVMQRVFLTPPSPRRGFFASLRGCIVRARGLYAGLAGSGLILAAIMSGGPRDGTVGWHLGVSAWSSLLTQSRALVHYLRLSLWPHPLTVSYDWRFVDSFGEVWAPFTVMVVLFGATVWALRRRPALGFCGAWFFLILGPTSSIVPITTEIVAERRMYLPLAAIVALVVVGGWRLAVALAEPRRRAALAGGLLALLAGVPAVASVARVDDYQSRLSIWEDAVAKQPANAYARGAYGHALMDVGRHDEALEQLMLSLELEPRHLGVWIHYGNLLLDMGLVQPAVEAFTSAVALAPDDPAPNHNLGLAFAHAARLDEAEAQFRLTIALQPDFADAHCNLGVVLAARGDTPGARRAYDEALRLDPGHTKARDARARLDG